MLYPLAHQEGPVHHLVGVAPDIRLEPTLAGVQAGRDELLERALEQLVIRRRRP